MRYSHHVIPVPQGMTPQEAWDEIRLLGCLTTEHQAGSCDWTVVTVPA